jgi:2',3'-cyclic-nucleotide 2'-phosphodiesterase (5'-nucleotidase family)
MYKNYSEKICTLIGIEDILTIEKNGSYYIGNLVVEIQKSFTGADISISSYGNLRGELNPGKIALFKVKDLIPYKNDLCKFSMYGYEVKKMMKIIQSGNILLQVD